ncbi:MAG: hypothetical protein JWR38_499 [Mucilaginibacter sp.]|nr:hypothetical protein [Mucilaginibacter sp.]
MKHDINREKLRSTLLSMASMFETGRIKRMRDLTPMYPTGIVAALGINYGGYMTKCASPEKFVIADLIKLSQILDIDVEFILRVVIKEAQQNVNPKDISHLLNGEG